MALPYPLMGHLATYLQRQFVRHAPPGWTARTEVRLLPPETGRLLGYLPQADVVLERHDGTRHVWIEFEVSRADPVANHAKFASAHLLQPQPAADTFLAMVSPHVVRGRRNLAASTVMVMRAIGMSAHQTVLLPHLPPGTVQALNHSPAALLEAEQLDVAAEVERALAVAEPLGTLAGTRIHFAGDLLEVLLNVRRWNAELRTPDGSAAWARRSATYYVYDPTSAQFAPSKFAAYVPIGPPGQPATDPWQHMTIPTYAGIAARTPIFDGHLAWHHLTHRLGMRLLQPADAPDLAAHFQDWLSTHAGHVAPRATPPTFVVPPTWF